MLVTDILPENTKGGEANVIAKTAWDSPAFLPTTVRILQARVDIAVYSREFITPSRADVTNPHEARVPESLPYINPSISS